MLTQWSTAIFVKYSCRGYKSFVIGNVHLYTFLSSWSYSRVFRISNRVLRITENYHRIPKIRENLVPRIREIGSLHTHTRYLTFSLKKPCHIGCSICVYQSRIVIFSYHAVFNAHLTV